jgi:hypothetical protein
MIIRRKENTSNFWKAIPSRTAEDRELSLEARGLLFYILVKPNNWELKREDLLRAGFVISKPKDDDQTNPRLMTERTLRRLIFELEEAGYLRRQVNTRRGGEWVMDAYDIPLPLDERTTHRGRTKPKNPDPTKLQHVQLSEAQNDQTKLHMFKFKHVQLSHEKNSSDLTEELGRSGQARKLQKHETDPKHVRSRSHVSLSSPQISQANCKTKTKKSVKIENLKTLKTGLPDDLVMDDDLLAMCRQEAPDINVFRVFSDFKDHARETGRECVDWIAAFRRWCRVAQERIEKGRDTNGNNQDDIRGLELLGRA